MLTQLKRLVPTPLLGLYHRSLSWLASLWYGYPSQKMIVVGVTGTNGKTTTSYLIAKALEAGGAKTGCTTTALFKIADREWLNDTKMTMLGRFALQRLLKEMVDAGCVYAIVETSSQGIVQHRHKDIAYDVAVFTNLTPEHVEAHGGFENYKRAKIELFRHVASRTPKVIKGTLVPKIAVLNKNDEHAKDFAVPGFDRTVWYGVDETLALQLPGRFNLENASAALAVADALGISHDAAKKKLEAVVGMPGRMEKIDEGQAFTVIVDYAPEPYALAKCYDAIAQIPHHRLIHVLGSAGGGRDVARRPILGRMAGENADVVIVTNEDPYDDDPRMIIKHVAEGAKNAAVKRPSVAVKEILDRREAIETAMREAKQGDLVLLTGKGCEQAIMGPNGSKTSWDERKVARDAIRAILSSNESHVSN